MRFRSRGTHRNEKLIHTSRRTVFIVVMVGAFFLLTRFQNVSQQSADSAQMGNRNSLLSDEFRVVPDRDQPRFQNAGTIIDEEAARAFQEGTGRKEGPDDLPETLTSGVQDDVLGVLSSELEAFFGTLKLATRVFEGRRNQMPEGRYTVLVDSPANSRGRPFRLRGRLRRLTPAVLPEQARSYGIREAWDAWISTPDSGSQLVHVIALTADPGLPVSESLGDSGPDVELAGYLFKREGYAAKGTDGEGELALAPLVLSDRLALSLTVAVTTRADDMNPWLTWLTVIVFTGVVVAIFQFRISDRAFRGTRGHQLTSLPVSPSFDGVESITAQQHLQQLERQAGHTPEAEFRL